MTTIPDGLCRCGCGAKTVISRCTNAHFGYIKGQPRQYIHGHNGRKPPAFYAAERGPNPTGVCLCGCGAPTRTARWSDVRHGYIKSQPLCYILGHSHRKVRDRLPDIQEAPLCACGCQQPTQRSTRDNPALGYVKGEYHRFLLGHATRNTLERELAAKVQKSDDGCWLWTGSVRPNGYGRINYKHGVISAHRAAWIVANGRPIPDGMTAMHRCDVRRCIRPDHLALGTFADNNRDTAAKGHFPVGLAHHNGRFTPEDVREIRVLHARGMSYAEIARRYGAATSTIHQMIMRRTYAYVV